MKLNMKLNIYKDETFVNKKLQQVLFLSMNKMSNLAKRKVTVDTGRLRSSIHISPRVPYKSSYTLNAGVDYAAHIEYGTSPHMPPVSELRDWARRVLKDRDAAFAVASHIRNHGTKAQPFFRPALRQVKKVEVPKFYKQVFEEK